MNRDSKSDLPPNELPRERPAPGQRRNWSGLVLFFGFVYLLAGGNKQFQDFFGTGVSQVLQFIGLSLALWSGYSLARARRIGLWASLTSGTPALLLVALAMLTLSDPPTRYVRSGNDFMKQGDHTQAIREFTKAIELSPKMAAAYFNRGNAHFFRKDHALAIADYDAAIMIEPRESAYYNNRAAAYLLAGDFHKAVADFTEAIRLSGDMPKAYFGRGTAHAQLGDANRAEADFSKARELDPNLGKIGHANEGDRSGNAEH